LGLRTPRGLGLGRRGRDTGHATFRPNRAPGSHTAPGLLSRGQEASGHLLSGESMGACPDSREPLPLPVQFLPTLQALQTSTGDTEVENADGSPQRCRTPVARGIVRALDQMLAPQAL